MMMMYIPILKALICGMHTWLKTFSCFCWFFFRLLGSFACYTPFSYRSFVVVCVFTICWKFLLETNPKTRDTTKLKTYENTPSTLLQHTGQLHRGSIMQFLFRLSSLFFCCLCVCVYVQTLNRWPKSKLDRFSHSLL